MHSGPESFRELGDVFHEDLADDTTAFEACAPLYLEIVISLYGALVALRAQPGSGKYTNVVRLFDAWFGAKAQAAHSDSIDRMRKAIAGLQEAQAKGQRASLDPALGTKVFE